MTDDSSARQHAGAKNRKNASDDQATKLTPMMAQYLALKEAHRDYLLFYRMGDFFELFFEDALQAASALDLTLTRRGAQDGTPIPMCGVPVHAHEAYLARLIRKGYKVAIADQVETPEEAKKRDGYKALVRRAVIRIVTPGTLTEDSLLDARAANYLVALVVRQGRMALAWADVSTGVLQAEPVLDHRPGNALARLDPREIVLSEHLADQSRAASWHEEWQERFSILADSRFDLENGRRRLEQIFQVGTLEGLGQFSEAEIAALGALVDYIQLTQCGQMPLLRPPVKAGAQDQATMDIDAATRRSLELTRTQNGERAGSLLDHIDMSVTAAGARLLSGWLAAPLTDPAAIAVRLDRVEIWVKSPQQRAALRADLQTCPDLERAFGRLSVGRGGPRDLAAIRDGLLVAMRLRLALAQHPLAAAEPLLWAALMPVARDLGDHEILIDRLSRALADELPILARDGGFIRGGYHERLDHFRGLQRDARQVMAQLQARYAEQTGVAALKIKHNNILGYFIEVTAQQAPRLQTPELQEQFIHRQTMAGATRFVTTELVDLERDIAAASDKALALELELFSDLCAEITGRIGVIEKAASAMAMLDVAAALAELACIWSYVRPKLDHSHAFRIEGGRHPVVEMSLHRQSVPFIANDADFGPAGRLWLLTGPNMGGKSTFLRQNALIAILAQAGSFVPAKSAEIGIVDRLFSRVGAADDLARGRSTFMVEMVETAAILNQATDRSLVILDEIGRGTATYDGVSIAWACLEHLHDRIQCRGGFATHYHELTALAQTKPHLQCYTMKVREWQDQVIFLHSVVPGVAERSFGLHVARLAGLPPEVVGRAAEILGNLEQGRPLVPGGGRGRKAAVSEPLPLFSQQPVSKPSPVLVRLQGIEANDLTPRAALDLVYELTELVRREG